MPDTLTEPPAAVFNPFGAEFRIDPFPHYPFLVTNSPGFVTMEGVPSCYVSSYDQVTAVMRNFKGFSSLKPPGLPGMERIDFFNGQPVMNYSDPPDHTRRRKVVNAAFTPMRIRHLENTAAIIIKRLLDAAEARGTVDAVAEITKPLANELLLGALMDVAPEDWHIFLDYVKTLPLLDKVRPGEGKPQAFLDAWAKGEAYCRAAVARAKAEKKDNLLSLIAAAAEEGGALSDAEMMAMLVVLFSGGMSTMSHAAAATLLGLVQTPGAIERVRQDPALAEVAMEEALRLWPAVMLVMRFAAADTEIGGKPVPKGMPVYVMISAANHDPATFPDPDRFDIDRPNVKTHVAFGYGMHTCIGSSIARALMPMLIRAMVDRFPNMQLASPVDQLEWENQTPRARHLGKLPLRLG